MLQGIGYIEVGDAIGAHGIAGCHGINHSKRYGESDYDPRKRIGTHQSARGVRRLRGRECQFFGGGRHRGLLDGSDAHLPMISA
jgi:hypothetical protein